MIIALFAVDDNGGIGNNGGMPWPPNKEDFKWFRETTLDQVVVMGKTTWNSSDMPKPLPKRINVVISNNSQDIENADAVISGNVAELLQCIDLEYKEKDIFVIGGSNILMQAKPVLEKLYITRISGIYTSDTSINLDEFLKGFKLINVKDLGSCKVEEYINERIS